MHRQCGDGRFRRLVEARSGNFLRRCDSRGIAASLGAEVDAFVTGRRRSRPRWGQNFLVAPDVARSIVEWADVKGRRVLEIGPGKGALTGLLLERAAFVRAVEIDPSLAEDLKREYFSDTRLEVVVDDVLRVPMESILDPDMTVVANLPYESATAIIRALLDAIPAPREIVVMVQREVCRRLAASEGDKEYGLLGLHTSLRADVEPGRVIPPGCFRPIPQVDSQLVRLRPLGRLRCEVGDVKLFSEIAAVAFHARRKMVRNSVVPFLRGRIGADAVEAVMRDSGIDETLRPERISLSTFARLSGLVHAQIEGHAGVA
ncbi:MAG: ribosomal RNA small subunit methyltransferase A [Myxococcales bacterium]|nr:MAG: ribosomal RNA small subunit methyltransferase A [Myxococcales bacterium]